MPDLLVELPCPHPGQWKVLDEINRFNVIDCGRRWGKTVLGVNRLIPPALDGYPVAWFAPSYKYLAEVWRDFIWLLRDVIARSDKTERRIELITGGVIEFWSLEDPDAGRSRKYRRIVIDEAAKVKNLTKCWTEAIRATLADFRGEADFLSTPKGRDGFWELYCKGDDPLETEWSCWQMPTSTNPYIHPDEIRDLKRSMPERVFNQEILAEFHDDGGGVFRKVKDAVDIGRTAKSEPPKPGVSYSMGSDLARKVDFTVNTVLAPEKQLFRQVFFDRLQHADWTIQLDLIAQTSRTYNNAPVTFDATAMGGDMTHSALKSKRMGPLHPYVFTNSSKEALINNLALMFEQGSIRLADIPEQTAELMAFEYEVLPGGLVRMQAPEGMHDDIVMSLALAAWGKSSTRQYGFK